MLNRGALRGLLVALMLLVESGSGEADTDALSPSPSDLLEHPDRYDGKVVRLEGPVESFREKVSQDGTPFFRFVVTDGSRGVAVFGIGRSTCRRWDASDR